MLPDCDWNELCHVSCGALLGGGRPTHREFAIDEPAGPPSNPGLCSRATRPSYPPKGSGSPHSGQAALTALIFAVQIWHARNGGFLHLGQRSARREICAEHEGQAINFEDIASPESPSELVAAADASGAAFAGAGRLCFLRFFFFFGFSAFSAAGPRSVAEMSRAAFAPRSPLPQRGKS